MQMLRKKKKGCQLYAVKIKELKEVTPQDNVMDYEGQDSLESEEG